MTLQMAILVWELWINNALLQSGDHEIVLFEVFLETLKDYKYFPFCISITDSSNLPSLTSNNLPFTDYLTSKAKFERRVIELKILLPVLTFQNFK